MKNNNADNKNIVLPNLETMVGIYSESIIKKKMIVTMNLNEVLAIGQGHLADVDDVLPLIVYVNENGLK